MKKVLALIMVLSMAVAFSACGAQRDPSGISLEEFEEIDTGMEKQDVEVIIGGTGVEVSKKKIDTDEYIDYISIYKYKGETEGYAEIEFTKRSYKELFKSDFSDPKVTAKTQNGLSHSNHISNSHSNGNSDIDYSLLSNDECAKQLAKELSIDGYSLSNKKQSDVLYSFETEKSDCIEASFDASEDKTIILSMTYDKQNKEEKELCFKFFKNAIDADIFNFTENEQSYLFSCYENGAISFKNQNFTVIYNKNKEDLYNFNVDVVSIFFNEK